MKIAFKNFLTTLRRYKTASLLNVAGLALAFAAFYAILSQVWWEVTFNRAIPAAERTYAAVAEGAFGDDDFDVYIARPSIERALAASPEVEAAGAVTWWGGEECVWVRRSGAPAPEKFALPAGRTWAVSEGVLDVLPFRAAAGDLRSVGRPGTVILSQSEAQRLGVGPGALLYVNQLDPVTPLEVAAVYEDLPDNSIGRDLDFLRFIGDEGMDDCDQWNTFYYLRLREGADPVRFTERWTACDREVRQVGRLNERGYVAEAATLHLVPVTETYFHPRLRMEAGSGTRAVTLTLTGIAVLILVVALINFVNFFFALLPARLRTVNVLKVFGAPTAALRFNFLFEAVGFVLLSLPIAWYLVVLLQHSPLQEYFPESLSLADNLVVSGIVFCVAVAAVLLAGFFPACYITSFSPALAAKGYAGSRRGRRMRTLLVGMQSLVAQCLVVVALVMWGQYRYMAHADPGFRHDNLLVTTLPGALGNDPLKRDALARRLAADPQIARYAFSSTRLPLASDQWNWAPTTADGREATFVVINCDTAFLPMLGIEIVEGRGFTHDDWSVAERRMIVNACAQRRYGLHPGDRFREGSGATVGSVMRWVDAMQIVGIGRDFRYASMRHAVDPLLFCLGNRPDYRLDNLYLNLSPGADAAAVSRGVGEAVHEVLPSVGADEVEVRFFDRVQSAAYARERRAAVVVSCFGLLAVVISLMGVFGLVLFETQHRRREIAVRKVMGATTGEVLRLLNRRYLAITLAAFVGAAPVAWYFSRSWLAEFAYRMPGTAWFFALALAAVAAVTFLTVTVRSWHAANENPAEAVKGE